MRVYEIAKEIGIPNKDLIAKIRALGLEVNNHMSSLDATTWHVSSALSKKRRAERKLLRKRNASPLAVLQCFVAARVGIRLKVKRPRLHVLLRPQRRLRPSTSGGSSSRGR